MSRSRSPVAHTEPGRPVVLIACGDVWLNRSLKTIFEENGYRPVSVRSGSEALTAARETYHDVVLLDEVLEGLNGLEVCRALHDDPLFDHSTPIVIISVTHTPGSARAAAAAGAWDYSTQPLDFEVILLKLATFRRAQKTLRTRFHELVDSSTGLYTPHALERVTTHLGARAMREHEPIACVAMSVGGPAGGKPKPPPDPDKAVFAQLASVIVARTRKSDFLAYLGPSRLAIVAPDTDAERARRMVRRLQMDLENAARTERVPGDVRIRAGYCAIDDFSAADANVLEFVHRAEVALDSIPPGTEQPVLGFEQLSGGGPGS